jgi:hypothetical protein
MWPLFHKLVICGPIDFGVLGLDEELSMAFELALGDGQGRQLGVPQIKFIAVEFFQRQAALGVEVGQPLGILQLELVGLTQVQSRSQGDFRGLAGLGNQIGPQGERGGHQAHLQILQI